ncbi:MsnO8 family LLM class oxidoreductase [Microbacterium gubbeenense]|uniref:MsnO8 family LLM class oxidoreductase n=1 Tax=Microbacterium gubbeenense TaxID=159896 RepID=UPI003F969719
MELSLLDRSRTRAGDADGQALHDSIARAKRAEELGYRRFWVAEHHAVPGIASGSPAVLLAAIGQVTERIRLGSGGVMLPQHQPLVVAEQFRMLASLTPDRIDLGVGNSLGFTPAVRRALRRERTSPAMFEREIRELVGFLRDEEEVTARPATPRIPVHVLATRSGVDIAARLGLPVVVGGPLVLDDALNDTLARYRDIFSPHAADARPHVILSVDAFAAENERRARELALPEAWAMAMSRRTGEFPPLESPERILAQTWSDRVRERVDQHLEKVITGTHGTVAARLHQLIDDSGADEIMASTSTFDRGALGDLDAALVSAVTEA